MLLHAFRARGRMSKMKHDAGFFTARSVRNQLGHAPLIDTNAMAHQRLVVSARALPHALAGKTKLTRAERMIRNHPAIVEAVHDSDSRFTAFAPGNIKTLSRVDHVIRELAL